MYKRGMCKQVVHGCHVAAIPKKIKNTKTQKVLCANDTVQCEVENNGYLTGLGSICGSFMWNWSKRCAVCVFAPIHC